LRYDSYYDYEFSASRLVVVFSIDFFYHDHYPLLIRSTTSITGTHGWADERLVRAQLSGERGKGRQV
jgi:hypothetical protein